MELPRRGKITQKIDRCSQGGHAEEDARDRERWSQMIFCSDP